MPANSTLAVRLGFCSTRDGYGYVPSLTAKFPLPRWDFNMFCACVCLCFQGGGSYVSGGTVTFSLCTISGNTAGVVRAHAQNFPSAGILDVALVCLQGGGVYVYRGTVTFTSSSISGNTANAVRAHVQKFLSIYPYPSLYPSWENCRRACLDSHLLAQCAADAPVKQWVRAAEA